MKVRGYLLIFCCVTITVQSLSTQIHNFNTMLHCRSMTYLMGRQASMDPLSTDKFLQAILM